MDLLENIEKIIVDAEKAVEEAEQGIRLLKAAEEDATELEANLKVSKLRLIRLKTALLKEKPLKE